MHDRLFGGCFGSIVLVALTAISVLSIAVDCVAQDATATRPAESQWRSDILKNIDAFRAMFKPGTIGSNVSEIVKWRIKSLGREKLAGGEERIAQLREAIQKYPNSPFADDAALLLARAYFLYIGDTDKAIAALRDVVKKYPDGKWIAEDPVVLSDIWRWHQLR